MVNRLVSGNLYPETGRISLWEENLKMLLDKSLALLEGACDIHIHGGPDIVQRRQDIVEIAAEAKNFGMQAVVFKDHNNSTADRAKIARQLVPDIGIFGGIVLNHAVGGFNVHAVDMAIKMGVKIVWMPSIDACYTIHKVKIENATPWLKPVVWLDQPEQGLTVLDTQGEIRSDVKEILDLIRDAGIILDTCHLNAKESYKLVTEAKKMGLTRIVVTHPNCSVNKMTIAEQRELAEAGALLTYAFLPCMPMYDGQQPGEIAAMIKQVGARHCILISDFGQVQNPTVVEGMRMFIAHMLTAGLSDQEIEVMVKENPQMLLNLS